MKHLGYLNILLVALVLLGCGVSEKTKAAIQERAGKSCSAKCRAVNGKRAAHGPTSCICRDADGCTIVFASHTTEDGYIHDYSYGKPVTVGRCVGIREPK